MQKPNVLVIGDTCLDVFNYCACERLCPEAPVPVLDIENTTRTLGMAGNVYRNIVDLDAGCTLLTNPNFESITKTRYVDIKTNHMFIRIDSPQKYARIEQSALSNIKWDSYDAVILSDYKKGFLTEEDIKYISCCHPLTFLDTKKTLGDWSNDVTFIKINRKEYEATKPYLNANLSAKIIETLGEGGCVYQEQHFPVTKVEVKDLSGAGDSFLAALVVKYVQTSNITESLTYANEVATIVVQKMGVSTIKD